MKSEEEIRQELKRTDKLIIELDQVERNEEDCGRGSVEIIKQIESLLAKKYELEWVLDIK